ncbi:unnamed protein product (macronuclear) [Paramecium tetraurelia]|uniref:DBF4-type domain-containing protein n=1 Tax=Paramecium tetraurelia TaxID=5888 RepID=A0EFT1_PARTE|nr:uncharacterized protein GSPATT00026495001 [Paramecium tetraurelia]CAK94172.1 unnamed protein product [Paramecium tetraurelia]|eukprot:XP_001461545.1 hypothetical protein (macronuclear) [Paramecium tetraurelia strain d4-2]
MNCKLCKQSSQQLIFEKLQIKYFEAFNFYFAKPINEILSQIANTPHVIYYKDYVILDEQQEYMKRYYKKEEVKPRLDILIDFYVTNYKEAHPYLLVVESHTLMAKRNKKIDKLYYQRMQESENSNKSQNPVVVNNVLNSKLSSKSQISYETVEHDIYSSEDQPQKQSRIDFKGITLLNNPEESNLFLEMLDKQYQIINKITNKNKLLPPNFYIKSPTQSQQNIQTNLIKDLHAMKSAKRRTHNMDLREKKAIFANSKSESKHSQSSFKMSRIKDSVDQQGDQLCDYVSGQIEPSDLEGKNKMSRIQNDNFTVQKMLKEYQGNQIRQLRSTISQDLLVASTSTLIQGFQGSQKSSKQDQNNNNGSIQNISQRQEQLKKVYQPAQKKKINQNQLDKIAKGGCLTDRNMKQLPISEDLFNKLHDIKIKSSQNAESQKKPEFNYMIPSQYNAMSTFKIGNNNKAKSQYAKKNMGLDLATKSQHQQQGNHSQSKVLNINTQKTDDIVKKYIQLATQSIQNHKKFDFKLNLQNLNNNEPHLDEELCIYNQLYIKQKINV